MDADLSTFVRDALVEIAEGVIQANKVVMTAHKIETRIFQLSGLVRGKDAPGVRFDVAVVARSESSKGAGGKLRVAVVDVGAGASGARSREEISRIAFEVALLRDFG